MGRVPWEELLSLQCWGPAAKPGPPTAMITELWLNCFLVKTTNSRVVKQVSKISWHSLRCQSFFPFTPQGFRAGSDGCSEHEVRSRALGGM